MFIKLHYHTMGGRQEMVINSADISRYVSSRDGGSTVWLRSDPDGFFDVDETMEEISKMLGAA